MTKMTIHKALAELKTLEKRITDSIKGATFLGQYQAEKNLIDRVVKKEDFEKKALSDFQAITDLINRKIEIKKAIVASNAKTIVKIGDKEMSVADAITYKSIIEYKKVFCNKIISDYKVVVGSLNRNNESVDAAAEKLLTAALGADKASKPTPEMVQAITGTFRDANEWHLSDPIKAEQTIEAMRKEINLFETEVDAVLSESNAVTFIEI